MTAEEQSSQFLHMGPFTDQFKGGYDIKQEHLKSGYEIKKEQFSDARDTSTESSPNQHTKLPVSNFNPYLYQTLFNRGLPDLVPAQVQQPQEHERDSPPPHQLDLSTKSRGGGENEDETQPDQPTYNEILSQGQLDQKQMIQNMLAMQAQQSSQAQAQELVQARAQAAHALAQAHAQFSRQFSKPGDFYTARTSPEPPLNGDNNVVGESNDKEPEFQSRNLYGHLVKPEPTPAHQMFPSYLPPTTLTNMDELKQSSSQVPVATSNFSGVNSFQHFGGYPFRPGFPSPLLSGFAGMHPFLRHPTIAGLSPPNTPLVPQADTQADNPTNLVQRPEGSPSTFPLTPDSAGVPVTKEETGVFQFPSRQAEQHQSHAHGSHHDPSQSHGGGGQGLQTISNQYLQSLLKQEQHMSGYSEQAGRTDFANQYKQEPGHYSSSNASEQHMLKFPLSGGYPGMPQFPGPVRGQEPVKPERQERPLMHNGKKVRNPRTIYSSAQIQQLEITFQKTQYLALPERADLASALGLTQTQVKIWFQNRRSKYKKQAKGGGGSVLPDHLEGASPAPSSDNPSSPIEESLSPNPMMNNQHPPRGPSPNNMIHPMSSPNNMIHTLPSSNNMIRPLPSPNNMNHPLPSPNNMIHSMVSQNSTMHPMPPSNPTMNSILSAPSPNSTMQHISSVPSPAESTSPNTMEEPQNWSQCDTKQPSMTPFFSQVDTKPLNMAPFFSHAGTNSYSNFPWFQQAQAAVAGGTSEEQNQDY